MGKVMSRPLRIKYEGAVYHITARGNERKRIFFATSDYTKFKEYLREAQDRYGYLLHCYMLMLNHSKCQGKTARAELYKRKGSDLLLTHLKKGDSIDTI